MNWDPNLIGPSGLALWQIAFAWLIYLPLVFLLFMFLVITGIVSINMTESILKQEYETAGPVKYFFLLVFAGPMLAIIGQALLCVFITTAVTTAGRAGRE